MMKSCDKCGTSDRYADGRCKACAAAYRKSYYIKNADKAKAYSAAYLAANPEKVKAKDAAYRIKNSSALRAKFVTYRAANIEMCRARDAAWRAANPDIKKACQLAYRAANPEKTKARDAAYRAAHPEKQRANRVAWRAANPEATRIFNQNYQAKKRANGGTLSGGLSAKLFKLQKGKCACCGQPLGTKYHLDHIMPIALGGSNTDDNMQLLRQRCNSQKSAKHPVDFMQQRGFLL